VGVAEVASGVEDCRLSDVCASAVDSCRGHCRAREPPRQNWHGDSLVEYQWMVNGAEAATSYGVVSFLFNWTT
jgi:hypothetical protein